MPTWTNRLPPEDKHTGFDLRRTPTSASLLAVVTSEDMIVCDTHFFHGRTTPCERTVNDDGKTIDDTNCGPCREKQGYRTHAYVSAFDCKRREHFLFECTAHAAKAFAEYREANGTLRGCAFQAARPKATPNGKVAIVTNTMNLAKVSLPQPPDLQKALCVIWRIPLNAFNAEDLDERLTPHEPASKTPHKRSRANAAALAAVTKQPDDAGPNPNLEKRRAELIAALEKEAAKPSNGHKAPQPA